MANLALGTKVMRRTSAETSLLEGTPMPTYECCFLGENEQTLRTETFRAHDDRDAHREVMTRLTRVGRFSGYELSAEGRTVEVYKPIKEK